jgi:PIN domain nuclease of toxin-antitoxin system
VKLLLDTHALIWALADDPALSQPARDAIANPTNEVLVSAASAMEVTTKYRLGKLPLAAVLAEDFTAIVAASGFTELPISSAHAALAGAMKIDHKDPFDRFLIAQAQLENVTLVSNEAIFDGFGVRRLW